MVRSEDQRKVEKPQPGMPEKSLAWEDRGFEEVFFSVKEIHAKTRNSNYR